MKWRDLLVILILFTGIALVFFTSCEEEGEDVSSTDTVVTSDTVYTRGKTIFLLRFKYDRSTYDEGEDYSSEEKEIYVRFLTDNLSELPELTINDTTFRHFRLGDLYLMLYETIPYSKTLNYSVSIGDSSTTGTIEMPVLEQATCNDSSLFGNKDEVIVPEADSFRLEWDSGPDYAMLTPSTFWNQQWQEVYTEANHHSIDTSKTWTNADVDNDGNVEASAVLVFYLDVANGVQMVSGATPNVKGDYGNGYVNAVEEESLPEVGMPKYTFPKATVQHRAPTHAEPEEEEVLKQLKEKYEQVVQKRD
ncbi:MAG: hypothetical protein KGY60_13040 [Bacteroidales bacterium]|nr:hypothetical protein [Bacteroidales bacterium]